MPSPPENSYFGPNHFYAQKSLILTTYKEQVLRARVYMTRYLQGFPEEAREDVQPSRLGLTCVTQNSI